MAVMAGQLLGGLFATFAVSRLLLWLSRKWEASWQRLLIVHALSLAIATIVAGYGLADGGPPQWLHAFLIYLLPQIVWLIVDLLRLPEKPAVN